MTVTIKIRDSKALEVLEGLEELLVIEIVDHHIPEKWSSKKKKQARDFLAALAEVKAAEAGKAPLKSAESLLDEL